MKDIINLFRRKFNKIAPDIAFLKKQPGTPMVTGNTILHPSVFAERKLMPTMDRVNQQTMCYRSFRNLDEHDFKVFGVTPSLRHYDNAWFDIKNKIWYPYNTGNEPVEVRHPFLNHIAEHFG